MPLERSDLKDDCSKEEILDLITKFIVRKDGSIKYQLGLFIELTAVDLSLTIGWMGAGLIILPLLFLPRKGIIVPVVEK